MTSNFVSRNHSSRISVSVHVKRWVGMIADYYSQQSPLHQMLQSKFLTSEGYIYDILLRYTREVRCFLWGLKQLEFDIFIITQILNVMVTFKSNISNFRRAYIPHISAPTPFKWLGIWWGTLCLKANQHLNTGITMTIPHIDVAKMWIWGWLLLWRQ